MKECPFVKAENFSSPHFRKCKTGGVLCPDNVFVDNYEECPFYKEKVLKNEKK